MKKSFTFILMMMLLVAFGTVLSTTSAQESNVENVDSKVASLFTSFYDDGAYIKNTKINVDTENELLVKKLGVYFHASVPTTERTTYYSKDALWMSRGDGNYSYYGTAYEGEKTVGVTNAAATTPYVAPEDARVVLSGTGKNSMEEYYVTLQDFKDYPGMGWEKTGNYYLSEDAKILDNFRLFTAPLWLDTEESKYFIIFRFATVEVINGDLVMKLWVSEGDVGKLSSTDNSLVYGEEKFYVFSQATILHDHVWEEHTKEPTFVATGEKYKECSLCGEKETIEVLEKLQLEETIDAEKGDFYDGVYAFKGQRSDLTHESYVKLGEKGIYVYQLVTDSNKDGKTEKAHTELYFTLGETSVLDNSLSVHLYYETTPHIRSYTYSSTAQVKMDNDLAAKYCQYSIKQISAVDGVATYAYELFVDYSYFGLTETPETIKTQIRAVTGAGGPISNQTTGTLDYKEIYNHLDLGNVDVWDGTSTSDRLSGNGTETDPYLIQSAADLAYFAAQVNAGNTYAGQYVKLTKNIDLNNNGLVIGAYTKNNVYTNAFAGTFDGQNNSILSMNINSTGNGVGLFAMTAPGSKVKNINVHGSVTGNQRVGGVVGQCEGHIENCVNFATIKGTSTWIGGVIGTSGRTSVVNCVNNGSVTSNNSYGGGILGCVLTGYKTIIVNCTNNAAVSAKNYSGGIAGGNFKENCKLELISCINTNSNIKCTSNNTKSSAVIGRYNWGDIVEDGEIISVGTYTGEDWSYEILI